MNTLHDLGKIEQVKNFDILNNVNTYDHFYKHILKHRLYPLYNLKVRTLKTWVQYAFTVVFHRIFIEQNLSRM